MNTKKIDLINIGLIFISLIIAIVLPFKLFLFSYAVLGPLHYLTEINWLKEKKFFIKSKNIWIISFIGFAFLMSIYPIIKFLDLGLNKSLANLVQLIGSQANALLLMSFLFAVGLLFFKKTKHILLALLIVILTVFLLTTYIPSTLLFVGLFLPTLIHVYIFTLLFIFYGAIKSKSKHGIFLGFILMTIPLIISYIPLNPVSYKPSQETIDTFLSSNMQYVSSKVAKILGGFQGGKFYLLSEIGVRIQIFIAFAYTYHYLNWFSKTSIIGWKKALTKRKIILISFIWIFSIVLYIYNYKTGLIALLFLSLLHVFLEFPLNILSIKELLLLKKNKGN